jgi:class 3 adenylate cyclase
MSQTRRLAAILAADVVGYSRLMGADEQGTLNRLRIIRAEIIDPSIAQNRGRIVGTSPMLGDLFQIACEHPHCFVDLCTLFVVQ